MEKIEEKLNNEPDFESLRQKVAEIQKEEMIKKEKGEYYDPHFDFINPEILTEEDLIIFDKFLKKILTREEFENYRVPGTINDPRLEFRGFLGNKLGLVDNLKWFNPKDFETWEKAKKRKI